MSNEAILRVRSYMDKNIFGQPDLVDGLLTALLADGHILVEGPPGIAKTRAIKLLSECIVGSFHRIQFTPDLLPADLTGTEIYRHQTGTFEFKPGPLFHNLILADEINRAPAKVQSALLEAMAERQITVSSETHNLPGLFLVMATQNPLEQEGTYPLPEAQLDRFMLKLNINYPDGDTEREILALNDRECRQDVETQLQDMQVERTLDGLPSITPEELLMARREIMRVVIPDALIPYIINLTMCTRKPYNYGNQDLSRWISCGVSPRATIALANCARVRAWLDNRDRVVPEDIQYCIFPVFRHRVFLSMEAEADKVSADEVIKTLLDTIVTIG